jgi:DNA transformation protein
MKPDSFKDFVLDQLRAMRGLECRSMFGGFGLYAEEKFFGIIFQGRLFFKTSEASRAAYLTRGMKHFQPNAKQQLTSYYEVPADITEDAAELIAWANEAVKVAGK